MKPVKVVFKYDFAEGLIKVINQLATKPLSAFPDDDDRMVIAALTEVRERLYIRMAHSKLQYTVQLSPVQALAMRILVTDFINTPDTSGYMMNRLRQIADQVQNAYA